MNIRNVVVGVVVGVSVAVSSGTAAAQGASFSGGKMNEVEIARSLKLQAQLAAIESSKDAFISQLIGEWAAIADPNLFSNISAELTPLMRAATPWQLYAASLVGDFKGMLQVLQGRSSPGAYINTLQEPQAKSAATMVPSLLGSSSDSLVFTPIAPCRIADTRGVGARTGPLVGTPRTFDLTTDAFLKGQGGDLSCAGLPSFSPKAWSANITVVGYGANGGLQAWPYGGSAPSTSIINFFPTAYALANSSTLTGCYGCADDIVLNAFGAATHVIIDVMGFFEVASGFPRGVVTYLAGTPVSISPGIYTFVQGGTCPAGTLLIGGAQTNSSLSTNTLLTSDHYKTGNSWYEYIKNTGASAASATVYTACMDNY